MQNKKNTKNYQTCTTNQGQPGQSLVEVAISFLFLILLLAGTADLGRALFSYITLNDAAQEGVSYAAFDPCNSSEIRNRVKNYSDFPINFNVFPDSDIVITLPQAPVVPGKEIEVQVHYKVEVITPFLGTFIGSQEIPLVGSSKETILAPCVTPTPSP